MITFDTHKFVRTLKDAGVPESQAEAFKEAQGEADLATKRALMMCAVICVKWSNG